MKVFKRLCEEVEIYLVVKVLANLGAWEGLLGQYREALSENDTIIFWL